MNGLGFREFKSENLVGYACLNNALQLKIFIMTIISTVAKRIIMVIVLIRL